MLTQLPGRFAWVIVLLALLSVHALSAGGPKRDVFVGEQTLEPYDGVVDPAGKTLMARPWPVNLKVHWLGPEEYRLEMEDGVDLEKDKEARVKWFTIENRDDRYEWVQGCKIGWRLRFGRKKDALVKRNPRPKISKRIDVHVVFMHRMLAYLSAAKEWPFRRSKIEIVDFPPGCDTTVLLKRTADGTREMSIKSFNIVGEQTSAIKGKWRRMNRDDILRPQEGIKFVEDWQTFMKAVLESVKRRPQRIQKMRMPHKLVINELPARGDKIFIEVLRDMLETSTVLPIVKTD